MVVLFGYFQILVDVVKYCRLGRTSVMNWTELLASCLSSDFFQICWDYKF